VESRHDDKRTRCTAERLEAMRMLVTGGAGYVGSHTCVALAEAGHEVLAIDNFANSDESVLTAVSALAGRRFEWSRADIRDQDAMAKLIVLGAFDAIVHLAALKSVPESLEMPDLYWDNNVGGMAVLLRAVRAAGISMFVFSSSATVYGSQERVPITESANVAPLNPYACTKLAGERMLRDFAQSQPDFRACILRYFNPIGAHESGEIGEHPRQPASNLFPITLAASRDQRTIDIYGTDYETPDGSAIRDFIHVMDIAEAHVSAVNFLATEKSRGRGDAWIFNLGTGRGCSVIELIRIVEKVGRRPISTRSAGRRKGDIAISVADPSLSEALLGWRARRSLDEACADALRGNDRRSK
jgi:UDP-glucose 4-epimerase